MGAGGGAGVDGGCAGVGWGGFDPWGAVAFVAGGWFAGALGAVVVGDFSAACGVNADVWFAGAGVGVAVGGCAALV